MQQLHIKFFLNNQIHITLLRYLIHKFLFKRNNRRGGGEIIIIIKFDKLVLTFTFYRSINENILEGVKFKNRILKIPPNSDCVYV